MYMMLGKAGRVMMKVQLQLQLNNKAEKKRIRYGAGYPTTHIIALTGHPHSAHRIGLQLLQSTYEL